MNFMGGVLLLCWIIIDLGFLMVVVLLRNSCGVGCLVVVDGVVIWDCEYGGVW